ncbi:hypothetical protein HanIR_Chr05g0248031 [Helianthus annuus]|nr:hypothetical protein HanIR_Chr05g0248031 [Helianthus annuus]
MYIAGVSCYQPWTLRTPSQHYQFHSLGITSWSQLPSVVPFKLLKLLSNTLGLLNNVPPWIASTIKK